MTQVMPDGRSETKLERGFDAGWTTPSRDVVLYDANDGFFVLDGGRELRRVARIPTVDCSGDQLELVLFFTSSLQPAACDECVRVTLTDGPPLFEAEVDMLLDLGAGRASVEGSDVPRGCVVELADAVPPPTMGGCKRTLAPKPQSLEGEVADILRDFTLHSVSPNGRWHVYVGNDVRYDASHYQAVLLDPQSSDLYGLEESIEATDPWPMPLAVPTAVTMSREYYLGIDLMDPDGQIVWLDEGETLLMNSSPWGSDTSYLFEIGKRVTRVEGHVAIPVPGCDPS